MRTFAFLALLLTAAFVLAQPPQAQPSPVVNRPLSPEALPDLAPDLLDGSLTQGAEPDTVQPWRYFPLTVGNAWEYESSFVNAPEWDALRIDIPKDTLIDGLHYFIWEALVYTSDGGTDFPIRVPIRYDTLSAAVVDKSVFDGKERPFYWAPCPLDAALDAVVICGDVAQAEVSGTYEGVLDFEPDTTVTDVAVKTYVVEPAYYDTFAAGFGKALYFEFEDGGFHALRYARIDGEVFGTEQYPVPSEPGGLEPRAEAELEAWPNPFRERLTVAVTLEAPGEARLEVVDVLGRVVRRRDLGPLPAGRHTARLDADGLGAGVYLVRLAVAGTPTAVRRVTLLR